MSSLEPTAEQASIVDLVRETNSNLQINALAGTGKTSTLELIQAASRDKPVLCLAFNKKIAEEMAKRFPSTTTVRTFNGMGHRIWSKTYNVTVNPKKVPEIVSVYFDEFTGNDRRELSGSYWEIIHGVGYAKAIGYVPDGKYPSARRLATREAFHASLEEAPSPITADAIDTILLRSIKASFAGAIDYNDQVYMPALFGGTFPRFPLVLVDEAQDLSPVNHALLDKLVHNRVCAVGDPWQSIYSFRGAVIGGMSMLQRKFEMTEADLTISFRCPQAIVESVRWHVPAFKWIKPGGVVGELSHPTLSCFTDGSAIICRNNAPLFSLAFRLLGEGRGVSVAGSEIGPKLIGILKKIGDDRDNRAVLISKIEAWRDEKLAKAQTGQKSIEDMAACMKIFAGFGTTLASAIAHAEHLFAQKGSIKLLTGHKAKGLEWDTVYHLNPYLIGDNDQEMNLRYVISTRAKAALYEVNSGDIR